MLHFTVAITGLYLWRISSIIDYIPVGNSVSKRIFGDCEVKII